MHQKGSFSIVAYIKKTKKPLFSTLNVGGARSSIWSCSTYRECPFTRRELNGFLPDAAGGTHSVKYDQMYVWNNHKHSGMLNNNEMIWYGYFKFIGTVLSVYGLVMDGVKNFISVMLYETLCFIHLSYKGETGIT